MSRPTFHSQYNGTSCNSYNGGLIDFQDHGLGSEFSDFPVGVGAAPPMTSMANLAGFTTQPNIMGAAVGIPSSFVPQVAAAASLVPSQPSPALLSQMPMCQGQVLYGPPAEMYMNGKIYRCVDSPDTLGQAAAVVPTAPAAPVAPVAPVAPPKVGTGMSAKSKRDANNNLEARVAQKVEEYFNRNKNVGGLGCNAATSRKKQGDSNVSSGFSKTYDASDENDAANHMRKLNKNFAKRNKGK